MSRFVLFAVAAAVAGGWLAAAPVPADVKTLVTDLCDPSAKVRDEAVAALRDRRDAGPWVRRATRSTDPDTARRATALLDVYAKRRQAVVSQAIDACIKSGDADLFMEWHHFWQPENTDDLWPVGPRMAQVAHVVQEEYAKWGPPEPVKWFEQRLNVGTPPGVKPRSYDGPAEQLPK